MVAWLFPPAHTGLAADDVGGEIGGETGGNADERAVRHERGIEGHEGVLAAQMVAKDAA